MKKKKTKKKQVPAYAFGIDQINGIIGGAGLLGGITSGFGDEGSKADVAGGTISGLASGASAGMALGPIGAGVGAAIGGLGGLMTKLFQKKRLDEANRRKETMKGTAYGLGNTANMTQEYWQDNQQAYTFENGGMLPDLAYVDNDEVIRDNNGSITKVPNSKPGTDNHLIDASTLESVLSDKIKRPSTGKTFAEEGTKLTKMTKPSKGKDKFAQNSDMLNQRNANIAYNNLLQEQEIIKAKKGIKPKTKGIPAYAYGFEDDERSALANALLQNYTAAQTGTARADAKRQAASNILARFGNRNTAKPVATKGANPRNQYVNKGDDLYAAGIDKIINFFTEPAKSTNSDLATAYQAASTNRAGLGARQPIGKSISLVDPSISLNPNKRLIQGAASAPALYAPQHGSTLTADGYTYATPINFETPTFTQPTAQPASATPTVNKPVSKGSASAPVARAKATQPVPQRAAATRNNWNPDLTGLMPTIGTPTITGPANAPIQALNVPNKGARDLNKKLKQRNLGEGLMGLAPTISNFIQGLRGSETEDVVLNPYAGAGLSAIAKRRMNIEPAMAANRRSRAIANYNMSNMNANTGMNLAARTQMAANEYANNADLYATAQNANNAYLGEYANFANNLGQQYVQGQTMTNDINARNRAAARNYTSTAASQIGQWSQLQEQMRNQRRRDDMMMPFLMQHLGGGYTSDMINDLINTYNRSW